MNVVVSCSQPVAAAKVLPASYGIVPKLQRSQLSFTLYEPRQITIEVNGSWAASLHLFASGFEPDVPRADGATVNNVRFQNIRVEQSRRLKSLGINKTIWSRDAQRGHIKEMVFKDISAVGAPLAIE